MLRQLTKAELADLKPGQKLYFCDSKLSALGKFLNLAGGLGLEVVVEVDIIYRDTGYDKADLYWEGVPVCGEYHQFYIEIEKET